MIGKVEKEVAKASSLMEGVEAEIGKKRAVSRKVGGWLGGLATTVWLRPLGCDVAKPVCRCRVRLLRQL